nr:MAG TPA: hypothetical protein [Caudoviricetes sp.]
MFSNCLISKSGIFRLFDKVISFTRFFLSKFDIIKLINQLEKPLC